MGPSTLKDWNCTGQKTGTISLIFGLDETEWDIFNKETLKNTLAKMQNILSEVDLAADISTLHNVMQSNTTPAPCHHQGGVRNEGCSGWWCCYIILKDASDVLPLS